MFWIICSSFSFCTTLYNTTAASQQVQTPSVALSTFPVWLDMELFNTCSFLFRRLLRDINQGYLLHHRFQAFFSSRKVFIHASNPHVNCLWCPKGLRSVHVRSYFGRLICFLRSACLEDNRSSAWTQSGIIPESFGLIVE